MRVKRGYDYTSYRTGTKQLDGRSVRNDMPVGKPYLPKDPARRANLQALLAKIERNRQDAGHD